MWGKFWGFKDQRMSQPFGVCKPVASVMLFSKICLGAVSKVEGKDMMI
jgi:hypothetical protein